MDILRLDYSIKNNLFEDVIPFWLKFGPDKKNGGIKTCLDRFGEVYSEDKSVWMQGRTAYTFYNLCNTYGFNPTWKELADSCTDFLDKYCIDYSDGRMYFTVTSDGRPLRKRRYFFSEAFYVMTHSSRYILTHEKSSLEKARKYYDLMMSIYLYPSSDPYKITPKTIASTRETKSLSYPMILLNVTEVIASADPKNIDLYHKNMKLLIEDIMTFNHLETGLMLENKLKNGDFFFESASGRIVNPGHSIELSWFLADAAIMLKDTKLLEKSADIFQKAYEFGKDEKYGGILYFKDIQNKPIEAYEHDMKLWWVHTEALTAAIKFYNYLGDDKYLELYDEFYDYSFKHFADPEYGEWFGYLRRDGLPTEPACKGHTYKGPFHLIRMLVESDKVISKLVKKPFNCGR